MSRPSIGRRVAGVGTVGLVAAALLAAPSPASATSAQVYTCVETNDFAFSPPLSVLPGTSSVTLDMHKTCTYVTASTSPLAGGFHQMEYQNTFTPSLTGNCAFAFVIDGGVSVLLGGSVAVYLNPPGTFNGLQHKVVPVVPDSPCNESTASGVGEFTEVGPVNP